MNLIPQLPPEINAKILAFARADGTDRIYKTLRRVNKAINFTTTEMLVESQLKRLEKSLTDAQSELSAKWNENPSEKEGALLEQIFVELSKRADDLKRLKQQVLYQRANHLTRLIITSLLNYQYLLNLFILGCGEESLS